MGLMHNARKSINSNKSGHEQKKIIDWIEQ